MNEEAPNRKRRRSEDDESGQPSEPPATGLTSTTTADDGEESEKWSQDLHRSFIEAIYEAGVSQSSPSVILENMTQRPHSLTSERVKSHLQKYRKNKKKSKEEFLQDYDSFMRKALTVGGAGGGASHVVMPPAAMIEMMGGGTPSGGDIAAFLSYSVMTEGENKNASGNPMISPVGLARESQDYLQNFAGTCVPFPQLTEEEKRSPLGISMVYVMGLFSSLSQHMMNERISRAQSRGGNNPTPASNEMPPASMPPPESSSAFPQSAGNPSIGSNNIANGKYASSAAYAQPTNNNILGAQPNSQWNNNITPQFIQYASSNGGNQLLRAAGANRLTTSGAFLPIIPKPDSSVPRRNNVMPGTDWNSLRQPSGRLQMATQNPGAPSKPESFAQV